MKSRRNLLNLKPRIPNVGLWLTILPPLILNTLTYKYTSLASHVYYMSAILSLSLFLSAVFWFSLASSVNIPGTYIDKLYKEDNKFVHFVIIILISSMLMLFYYGSWITYLAMVFISHTSFILMCKYSMLLASTSFTVGEIKLIIQGIVIFNMSTFTKLMDTWENVPLKESELLTVILQVSVIGLEICIFILIVIESSQNIKGLLIVFIFFAIYEWLIVGYYTKSNVILWLYSFVTSSYSRVSWSEQITLSVLHFQIALLSYWLLICILTIISIEFFKNDSFVPVTIKRKLFHFVITAVYIPGIMLDINLLYLSSGIVLWLLVLIECCRVLKIQPFIEPISNLYDGFIDEKDKGTLVLTPLYLLLGCTLPLWLWPSQLELQGHNVDKLLFLLSGVLSLGIGDAAAATGGKLFGRLKWPGTKKTYVGTFCFILSQLGVGILICIYSGQMWTQMNAIAVFSLATTITGIVEALSNQIDNLSLPLIMMAILSFFS